VAKDLGSLFSLLLQSPTSPPHFECSGREFYFSTKGAFDFVQNRH
jgi:hypothetical protein